MGKFTIFILFLIFLGTIQRSFSASICNDHFQTKLILNSREVFILANVYGLHRVLKEDEVRDEVIFDLLNFTDSLAAGSRLLIEKPDYKLLSDEISNLKIISVEGFSNYKSMLDISTYQSLNFPSNLDAPAHTLTSFHDTQTNFYEYFWKISVGEEVNQSSFIEKLKVDYLDFVIQGYSQRLDKIDPSEFSNLQRISNQVKQRTLAIIKTKNGPSFAEKSLHNLGDPDIEGVITAVLSKNQKELLPVEILNKFEIERNPNEVIAEIGRFFVTEGGSKTTTPELISHIAHFLNSKDTKPDKLFIQVDAIHKRLFTPFGFTTIKTFSGIQGDEFLMEVSPELLRKNTMKLLGDWKDIDPQIRERFKDKWL